MSLLLDDPPEIGRPAAITDSSEICSFLLLPQHELWLSARAAERHMEAISLRYRYTHFGRGNSGWTDWRNAGSYRENETVNWNTKKRITTRRSRHVFSQYRLGVSNAKRIEWQQCNTEYLKFDVTYGNENWLSFRKPAVLTIWVRFFPIFMSRPTDEGAPLERPLVDLSGETLIDGVELRHPWRKNFGKNK